MAQVKLDESNGQKLLAKAVGSSFSSGEEGILALGVAADGSYAALDTDGEPYYLKVAKGLISGHSVMHKFGRNPDIDAGFETIWNGGGIYTGHNATAAQTVEVFSSDDADNGGTSTGAVTVELQGLDTNWLQITETVTLDGTTKVDSAKTYIRMDRAIVRSGASATAANLGTITVRQKTTTANIFAVLPIGYNETMIAAYTIPAGKTGYLLWWGASASKKQASFSNVKLLVRPDGEVFQVKAELTISTTGNSSFTRPYIIPKDALTAKSDIRIDADSSAADFAVAAELDILLVDD